ncbi:MAG TPA: alpha/beta hydrolase [Burkholderiaceae bacterium]|nr:alpha/beta hydrolase [Burkholderiaceae bacterium]HQR70311.1 alpha/beta hydrolase [Burkholderiaceae bacterium]
MSPLFPGIDLERRRVNGVEIAFRRCGQGAPLLLLHGFPQTHAIWHRVAPQLAARHSLVLPDLRGYGDSAKPPTSGDHAPYSKRALALDLVELMRSLGHAQFQVCGHDRGGRVAHRMALDHPEAVTRLMVLDISPTRTMYERTTMEFARLYYHWFFLIQPAPLPERLIAAEPRLYLHTKLGGWGSAGTTLFDPRALAEYERCFTPEAIHAMCEDYRAAAGIDLEHDRADSAKVRCPLRVLWGERGVVNRLYTPVADWQEKCELAVTGRTTPGGHYIPEESPELLAAEMLDFFGSGSD